MVLIYIWVRLMIEALCIDRRVHDRILTKISIPVHEIMAIVEILGVVLLVLFIILSVIGIYGWILISGGILRI